MDFSLLSDRSWPRLQSFLVARWVCKTRTMDRYHRRTVDTNRAGPPLHNQVLWTLARFHSSTRRLLDKVARLECCRELLEQWNSQSKSQSMCRTDAAVERLERQISPHARTYIKTLSGAGSQKNPVAADKRANGSMLSPSNGHSGRVAFFRGGLDSGVRRYSPMRPYSVRRRTLGLRQLTLTIVNCPCG
jgi:hypothetical protein